jgi:hypothetical protein
MVNILFRPVGQLDRYGLLAEAGIPNTPLQLMNHQKHAMKECFLSVLMPRTLSRRVLKSSP